MEIETFHYEFRNSTEICQSDDKQRNLPKIDECIKSIARKEGYVTCEVVKKTKLADGGNYLGSLCEIDINGKTADGDKETAIFVKSITSDCEGMELISVPCVYKMELFVYKELSQIFYELQENANVPLSERYNTVKCYEESYEKAIIMENIARKGFRTASHRMDVITLNVAEECIKQLARLHGLSFVLEHTNPEYFTKKIKSIRAPHIFGKAWDNYVEKTINKNLECLDEKLRHKIETQIRIVANKLEDYYNNESIKYCLCHGDYRPNNIMISEVDGKLTVIPVDYQIIYFGCPILDFVYFMYMSTDRQFRDKHMIDLKKLYYKSLENFLRYFDISAEDVLPRKIFEQAYEDKFDYGLAITILFCPFLFVDENAEIPDLTKDAIAEIDFKLDDRFKDRLQDAVEECIDMGYL